MIALDTSSIIAYFHGDNGGDVDEIEAALVHKLAVLPPAVLSELLSDPKLPHTFEKLINEVPVIDILEGYWERAGKLRSRLLAKGHKARLADALIAQSCLDHDVPLITRDTDFKHYARWEKLKLVE